MKKDIIYILGKSRKKDLITTDDLPVIKYINMHSETVEELYMLYPDAEEGMFAFVSSIGMFASFDGSQWNIVQDNTVVYWARDGVENSIVLAAIGAQSLLVSGENIKTINNNTLLGEGNISLPVKLEDLLDFFKNPPITENQIIIYKNSKWTNVDLEVVISGKENFLGNPAENNYILASTTDGTRYWIPQSEVMNSLPIASSTVLGGVKIGDRLSITPLGVLSANIQSTNDFTAYYKNLLDNPIPGIFNRLDNWQQYLTGVTENWLLSAYLGNDLNTRLSLIENGYPLTINTTGTGNAVTSISKAGTVITATKDKNFAELDTNGKILVTQLPSYIVLTKTGNNGYVYPSVFPADRNYTISAYRLGSNAQDFSVTINSVNYTKSNIVGAVLGQGIELILNDVTIKTGYTVGNVILTLL